jgi:hypothetical protein
MTRSRAFRRGLLLGAAAFCALLAILVLSGDLSSSGFIYVDF